MSQAPHVLDVAAGVFGGREAMAAALDVTVAAVGNWKMRGVPLSRCVAIERMTRGIVTRRDLRPDDWQVIWPELCETNPTTTPATQAPAAINHEVAHG